MHFRFFWYFTIDWRECRLCYPWWKTRSLWLWPQTRITTLGLSYRYQVCFFNLLFLNFWFYDFSDIELCMYFRISLKNLNTFGDEVFGDPKVLQSYYYGITHFIVGGRCKCNGHSNVCIPKVEMLEMFTWKPWFANQIYRFNRKLELFLHPPILFPKNNSIF